MKYLFFFILPLLAFGIVAATWLKIEFTDKMFVTYLATAIVLFIVFAIVWEYIYRKFIQ